MPKPPGPRPSALSALIYPFSLFIAIAACHYWFHLSDVVICFIVVVWVGDHELEKITDKIDAIGESVDSLTEVMGSLTATPQSEDKEGPNNCPACRGLICVVCGKPSSEDDADCPTCGRHWKGDQICGQRWTEAAVASNTRLITPP